MELSSSARSALDIIEIKLAEGARRRQAGQEPEFEPLQLTTARTASRSRHPSPHSNTGEPSQQHLSTAAQPYLIKTQELAYNADQPSGNEENDNDNDQQDQAAQEQSETDNHNDENDNDESSEEEEQTVDQATDIKPQVERQTEQILDQEGQESIDRQLQEEIAGTSRIDKGKEAKIQIEPLHRKDPYRKRLDKANTQAVLNEAIEHFIERYQLPDFLRETLYQQTPNIQKEFVDSDAARGFPEMTDEQFKQ